MSEYVYVTRWCLKCGARMAVAPGTYLTWPCKCGGVFVPQTTFYRHRATEHVRLRPSG